MNELEILQLILEYMGNSNVMREWLQHEDSQSGDSILHLICSRDNCDILKVVVEKMTEVFGEESPQLRNMLLNVNYKGCLLLLYNLRESSLNIRHGCQDNSQEINKRVRFFFGQEILFIFHDCKKCLPCGIRLFFIYLFVPFLV